MAASSYNATTGAPEYDDADAPDVAVNPTEVAAFAASVGTRLIGDDTSMGAYAYAREGLQWYNTTDKATYVHDGTDWVKRFWDTGWVNLAPSLVTGWTVQSPDELSYRVKDGLLQFRGRLDATSGASQTILSTPLPVGARPAQESSAVLVETDGSFSTFVMNVTTAGVIVIYKGANTVNDLPLFAYPPVLLG